METQGSPGRIGLHSCPLSSGPKVGSNHSLTPACKSRTPDAKLRSCVHFRTCAFKSERCREPEIRSNWNEALHFRVLAAERFGLSRALPTCRDVRKPLQTLLM